MKGVRGKSSGCSVLSSGCMMAMSAVQPMVAGMQSVDTLAVPVGEKTRTSTMAKTDEGIVLRSCAEWQGGVGPECPRTTFCRVTDTLAMAASLLDGQKEHASASWAKLKIGEEATLHGIVHDNQGPGECYQVRVAVTGDVADFLETEETYVARSAKTDNQALTVSDMETVKVTPDVTAFLNVETDMHQKARSHVEGPLEAKPSGAIRQFDTEASLNTKVLARVLKSTA